MNDDSARFADLSRSPFAAVFQGSAQPWSFVQAPDRDSPELAIVDVEACTLCSSDVHTVTGRRVSPTPSVLGHEAIGRVRRLPTAWRLADLDGRLVAVGDRVVWGVAAHCGQCLFCQSGIPQKCAHLVKYGHGVHRQGEYPQGGLSTRIGLANGTPVVVLDDRTDARVACLSACAGATVAAALRLAGGVAGRHVVIFGGGVLGCLACAMARGEGAEVVVCVEPDANRRSRAEAFGATVTIDPSEPELIQRLKSECRDGFGPDVCLELCGASSAFSAALSALRIGGTLVLAGAVFPAGTVSVAPEELVRRMITIRGLHNYAPEDLKAAVTFACFDSEQRPAIWAGLFSERFRLEEIDRAFAWAAEHPGVRTVVSPNG
jgi:alcohol dehydrogenase